MDKAAFAVTDLVTWNNQQGIVTEIRARGASVLVLFLDGRTREFTRRHLYDNAYVLRGESLPKSRLVRA